MKIIERGLLVTVVLILGVVLTSGCSGSNHFENSEISFYYPLNWKVSQIYDLPGVIVGISESSSVDVKIAKSKMSDKATLKELYDQSKANSTERLAKYCYQQVSEKNITVDGANAYERVYRLGCNETQTRQEIREVWLVKNGYIYIITCTAIPPEIFDQENTSFNLIIRSFHVKSSS